MQGTNIMNPRAELPGQTVGARPAGFGGSSAANRGGLDDQSASQRNFAIAMDEANAKPEPNSGVPQPLLFASTGGPASPDGTAASGAAAGTEPAVHSAPGAGKAARTGMSEGDVILKGMTHVRAMFDAQISKVNGWVNRGSITNAGDLLNAQAEVAKFSLMMDITSKLAGKVTQTTDTLLKG